MKKQKWYCLADNGELWFLGCFDSYESADIAAQEQGHAAIWLINQKSAEQWRKTLKEVQA